MAKIGGHGMSWIPLMATARLPRSARATGAQISSLLAVDQVPRPVVMLSIQQYQLECAEE